MPPTNPLTSLLNIPCLLAATALFVASGVYAAGPEFTGSGTSEARPPLDEISFYGQNTIDNRTRDLVTLNRFRASLGGYVFHLGEIDARLGAYAGAHIEKDTLSRAGSRLNDNFVAPLVGVQAVSRKMGLGLQLEAQYQVRDERVPGAGRDTRVSGRYVAFHSIARESLSEGPLKIFFESYSDAVHRTEYPKNGYLSHFTRLGPRYHFGGGVSADLFPDFVAHGDVAGDPWENYVELRAGARVNLIRSFWSAALQVSRATGLYAGDKTYFTPLKGLVTLGMEM